MNFRYLNIGVLALSSLIFMSAMQAISIHQASREGDISQLNRLIRKGARIDERDGYGATALMYAVSEEHLDAVRTLLKAGANVNAIDGKGMTALMRADESEMIRLLLDAGAGKSINAKSKFGLTALMYLVFGADESEVVGMLLEAGADKSINVQDKNGETALMHAIDWEPKDSNVIGMLLEAGADKSINVQDEDGNTALMWAVEWDSKVVNMLLEAGADKSINVQDEDGKTALMHAVGSDEESKIVDMLLKAGAIESINVQDEDGNTALMHAEYWESKVVAMLLKAGASRSINVHNIDSEKVPAHTSERSNLDMARVPLEHDSNRLHYAAESGDANMVKALLDKGITLQAKDSEGNTPLHLAAARDHDIIVSILLRAGATLDMNDQGQSPLDLARKSSAGEEYSNTVKLLEKTEISLNSDKETLRFFTGPKVVPSEDSFLIGVVKESKTQIWKYNIRKNEVRYVADMKVVPPYHYHERPIPPRELNVSDDGRFVVYSWSPEAGRIDKSTGAFYILDVFNKKEKRYFSDQVWNSGFFLPKSHTYLAAVNPNSRDEKYQFLLFVEINLDSDFNTVKEIAKIKESDFFGHNLHEIRRGSRRVLLFRNSPSITWCLDVSAGFAIILNNLRDFNSGGSYINASPDGKYVANDDGIWEFDIFEAIDRAQEKKEWIDPNQFIRLSGIIYEFRGWSPNGQYALFAARYPNYGLAKDGTIQFTSFLSFEKSKPIKVTKEYLENHYKKSYGNKYKVVRADNIAVYDRKGEKIFSYKVGYEKGAFSFVQWLNNDCMIGYDEDISGIFEMCINSKSYRILLSPVEHIRKYLK